MNRTTLIAGFILLTGCSRTSLPRNGEEFGDCYRNGTCDAGLTCSTSGICVDLGGLGDPSGGDPPAGDNRLATGCATDLVWETVDVFSPGPGISSDADGVRAGANGIVYAVSGDGNSTGNSPWTTRRSTDGGDTWQTVDVFSPDDNGFSEPYSVAIANDGRVAVTGRGRLSFAVSERWFVRLSVDGGAQWSTIDDFQLAANEDAFPRGIAFTPNGDLFVVGQADNVSGAQVSVTRRLLNGSSTWSVVDIHECGGNIARAFDVLPTPNGIFVASECRDGAVLHWTIRRSIDNGDSWQEVDNYVCGPTAIDCGAEGLAADGSTIYAAGNSVVGADQWLVRRSMDGGDTWALVDTWRLLAGQGSEADAVTVVPDGTIYAGGVGSDGTEHWIVRRSRDNGDSWVTVDDYQLMTGTGTRACYIHSAPDGTVYASGFGIDANGLKTSIVRRGRCP